MHHPPAHGRRVPAGSSSLPSWPRSRCCGRHAGPGAAPSGNPEINGITTTHVSTPGVLQQHTSVRTHGALQQHMSVFLGHYNNTRPYSWDMITTTHVNAPEALQQNVSMLTKAPIMHHAWINVVFPEQ